MESRPPGHLPREDIDAARRATPATADDVDAGRRGLLKQASRVAMVGGLVAGYGTFAGVAVRYLYPRAGEETDGLFLCAVEDLAVGASQKFRTPAGGTVVVARQGEANAVESFVALSSTCPHLGCQVHWEPHNDRFFCPCHNGIFDPAGKAIAGPPAEANQALKRYPLRVTSGLLYIQLPANELVAAGPGPRLLLDEVARGPGHDPCLSMQPADPEA